MNPKQEAFKDIRLQLIAEKINREYLNFSMYVDTDETEKLNREFEIDKINKTKLKIKIMENTFKIVKFESAYKIGRSGYSGISVAYRDSVKNHYHALTFCGGLNIEQFRSFDIAENDGSSFFMFKKDDSGTKKIVKSPKAKLLQINTKSIIKYLIGLRHETIIQDVEYRERFELVKITESIYKINV